MTISDVVQSGLFEGDNDDQQLIRIPIRADENAGTKRRRSRRMDPPSKRCRTLWSTTEHEALELYPSGPWKVIADHVGTRTTRQTMTHAQKYREKIERRKQNKRKGSVVRLKTAPESPSSPAGALLDDAMERAVLMEFVKNFQPSEIDMVNQPQHPHTQGSFFLLNVCV